MRPIRRRITPKTCADNLITSPGPQSFAFPVLDLGRSMDGADVSPSSAITIVTSAASSCTDLWSSSSGFVEDEEEEGEDDDNWNHDSIEDTEVWDEDLIVPKLEPEEEDVRMGHLKETSVPDTLSISSTPVTAKRPRGRPRKHPKTTPEEKAKITKNRSKTGCITCRRRKKKCDEKKPGCQSPPPSPRSQAMGPCTNPDLSQV